MEEALPDLTFVPLDARSLNAEEARLVEFLLDDPFAVPELRAQAASTRVVSRCGCGCASIGLEVDPAAPEARWAAAETPFGRADWVPLTAQGVGGRGRRIEVTLHVVLGYLVELEIWTGRFGDHVLPRPETLRRVAPLG